METKYLIREPLREKTYLIDTGESFLGDSGWAVEPNSESLPTRVPRGSGRTDPSANIDDSDKAERQDLSLQDFRRYIAWVRVHRPDDTKPINAQYAFRPWVGSLPVNSAETYVRVLATYNFRDGSEYLGYVRAIPEGWADIVPPPTIIGSMVIEGKSPRARYGHAPTAIIGEQLPCILVEGQKFGFWCGARYEPDGLRLPFYKAVGKEPDDIFPIRFQGAKGSATGILSGEIDGFYVVASKAGKAPWIVR